MALQPPSPKTQKKMEEMYQDPEATARDVQHIKEWLSKQPHLPEVQDDVMLEKFLHGCKYRLSRCKQVLDMYFTVRGAVPELFANRDPLSSDLQDIYKALYVSPLPKLTPEGHRIFFMGVLDADPARYNFVAQAKRIIMLAEAQLRLNAGFDNVYVFDMKDIVLAHLTKTWPTTVRSLLFCLQDAYPIHIKGIHFFNAPAFMDKIIQLIKPFLKEKIRERIHVHSSLDSLYDMYPKEIFPNEFGGQAGEVTEMNDWWQNQLNDMREWFLSEGSKAADEQKRVGKIANSEKLFGLEGTFKTLNID